VNVIRTITVDCTDTALVGRFWETVLGWPLEVDAERLREMGFTEEDLEDQIAFLQSPSGGPNMLFQTVPEAKQVKNRVHLDLGPTERSRDEEVEHLQRAGATVVGDHRNPDGTGWVVMADPEGNEFCVERSDAERAS
jgi:predicted enzyme related to lactoylglutathione lyase